MTKYHISEDGNPRVCTAAEGNCPLGSDEPHFSTKIAARAAYEASLDAELVAPSIRKKLPKDSPLLPQQPEVELETVQPEREYDYVYTPTVAGKLKKGDVYRFDDGTTGIVQDVKLGTKNATVSVSHENGKTKTLVHKLQEPVSINAKVETEESKARSMEAYRERELEIALKTYEPRQSKAVAEMVLKTQKGYVADSWDARTLINAAANDRVMPIYEHTVDRVKESIASGEEGFENERNPYSRAFKIVKEEFTREIMQNAGRGESNSTSAISNEFERELIKAKADFLGNIRWGW